MVKIESGSQTVRDIPFEAIVRHLNETTGKKFQWQNKVTQQQIKARWAEGWRLADFQYVHEVKTLEWLNTEMELYLRPSTLYRPKHFEGYRNQRKLAKTANAGAVLSWAQKKLQQAKRLKQ